MANSPKINISSLDFDDIKSSLKEYLADKPEFNSFDFNGSGINLLLDIFAYNTLYYAYYANMISNEMFLETAQIENNFASLLKPLGVLLPGKSCSVGNVTATTTGGTDTITAYNKYFTGTTNSGLTFRFYTIENIGLSSTPNTFNVYEAREVANDIPITIDIATQTGYISNTNLDINTIRVKVNGEEWQKYENSSESIGPEGKVYFIDRTAAGFNLVFGKRTINDFSNNYGKNVEATDTVVISYLVPSGTSANGVFKYNAPTLSAGKTVTVTDPGPASSGAADGPNLDLYRYSAPKIFAANDRAVTKDDFIGLLLGLKNSNILPTSIQTAEQINVWGGEEANPPSYGRIFMSFANETITPNNPNVLSAVSIIKRKTALTMLPEYIQAKRIFAGLDLNIVGGDSTQFNTFKSLINKYYNTPKRFNQSIFIGDIKNIIQNQPNTSSIKGININSIILGLPTTPSIFVNQHLYFKNELYPPTTTTPGQTINSPQISTSQNPPIAIIKDRPRVFNTDGTALYGDLFFYNTNGALITGFNSGNNPIGSVDYKNGIVTVYPTAVTSDFNFGAPITINAKPRYTDSLVFNNEIILEVETTIAGA